MLGVYGQIVVEHRLEPGCDVYGFVECRSVSPRLGQSEAEEEHGAESEDEPLDDARRRPTVGGPDLAFSG